MSFPRRSRSHGSAHHSSHSQGQEVQVHPLCHCHPLTSVLHNDSGLWSLWGNQWTHAHHDAHLCSSINAFLLAHVLYHLCNIWVGILRFLHWSLNIKHKLRISTNNTSSHRYQGISWSLWLLGLLPLQWQDERLPNDNQHYDGALPGGCHYHIIPRLQRVQSHLLSASRSWK